MNNKLYLISEEDYIKHMEEKVVLYSMLKQVASRVKKLPSNRGNKNLSMLTKKAEMTADAMFHSWGIPVSYLYTGDPDMLSTIMENELIEPEDAGYFCDDSFCCGNCECCCHGGCEDEDENAEEFEEMMAALGAIVHSIFGDDVTFHITVD